MGFGLSEQAASAVRRRMVMRQGVPVRPWRPALAVVAGVAFVAGVAMFAGGCSQGTRLPTDPGVDLTNTIDTAPPDPTAGEDYEPKHMPGPAQKPAEFCHTIYPFRTAKFSNPLRINNQWAPLIPGTQYVLQGVANRGGGPLPQHGKRRSPERTRRGGRHPLPR